MILGTDLSHWNGNTDYSKMKSAGIYFAFVKTTQGADITDGQAALHVTGLKNQGITYGYYHYVTDTPVPAQIANLQKFILANGFPPLGVFIDIETKLTAISWSSLLTAFKNTWGEDKVGVYCGQNSWSILGNPPDPGVSHWVANYKYHYPTYWTVANYRNTIEKCKTLKPAMPLNWTSYQYWQFTGDMAPGSEFGVSSAKIDLNFYMGELADLYPPTQIDLTARVVALESQIATLTETVSQMASKSNDIERSLLKLSQRVDGIQVGLRQGGGAV